MTSAQSWITLLAVLGGIAYIVWAATRGRGAR